MTLLLRLLLLLKVGFVSRVSGFSFSKSCIGYKIERLPLARRLSSPNDDGGGKEDVNDVGATLTSFGGLSSTRFPYGNPDDVDRLFSNLNYDVNRTGNEETAGQSRVKVVAAVRKKGSLATATALVTGTTIGAGILALPAVSLSAGTLPSTVVLCMCWLYMTASGLLIAEVNLNSIFASGRPGFSVLSMTRRYLGETGGLLSGTAYVFIHYALLVAYIAQGGGILGDAIGLDDLLSRVGGPVLFVSIFGGLLAFGSAALVDAANSLFVLVVVASFVALLCLAAPDVRPEFLLRSDWTQITPAIPTMIVALVFHNVVPVITTQLEGDRGKITSAIVLGSAIPLLMFLAWNAVILGSVSPEVLAGIQDASVGGAPFDPLEQLRSSGGESLLSVAVSVFSLFAIVTSFIGFVVGLKDFYEDAFFTSSTQQSVSESNPSTARDGSKDNLAVLALVLLPPMLFAIVDPDIFFGALDSAGTFGISLLFGLVPAVMAWRQRYGLDDSTGGNSLVAPPMVPGGKLSLTAMIGIAATIITEGALDKLGFLSTV